MSLTTMLRRALVLVVLVAAVVNATDIEQERFSASFERDLTNVMGASALATAESADDSITVVPHNYFSSSHTEDRSLLHAADTIRHSLKAEAEERTFADIPDLFATESSKDRMEQATYTEEIDPAFLLETGTTSIEHEVNRADELESVLARSQEMAIGLIEQSSHVEPTKPAAAAEPVDRSLVAQKSTATAEAKAEHPHGWQVAHTLPRGQMADVDRRSRRAARAARRAVRAARRAARQFVTPETRRAPRRHHGRRRYCTRRNPTTNKCERRCRRCRNPKKYRQPAFYPQAPKRRYRRRRYCVVRNPTTNKCERRCRRCRKAPRQYRSPAFYRPQAPRHHRRRYCTLRNPTTGKCERRCRRCRNPKKYRQPAFYPQAPKRRLRRRYCVLRNTTTRKCERRCRRCHKKSPRQYRSPAFYKQEVPLPARAPGGRVLVMTPSGRPVYVIYRAKAVASPDVTAQAALSRLAFNTPPRAATHGAQYLLPQAPQSPYALQHRVARSYSAVRRARRAARRAARQAARLAAQVASQTFALSAAKASRRSRRAAARAARKLAAHTQRRSRRQAQRQAQRRSRREALRQRVLNTVYDPKTNTVLKHIHHHSFSRLAPVASVPTLELAYVKLCKLQRAIVSKYNRRARHAAYREARRAARRNRQLRAFRRAFAYRRCSRRSARAGRCTRCSTRRARAGRCSRRRPRMVRAGRLPSSRVLSRINNKYSQNPAKRNEAAATALRRKYSARQQHLAQFYRAQNAIERAHRVLTGRQRRRIVRRSCRRLARKAGKHVPRRCSRSRRRRRTSRKVFSNTRYNPLTNRVRFSQVNAEAEAEAGAETEVEQQTETDAEAETEVDAEAETETEVDAAAETEAETEVEAGAETEVEAEAAAESETPVDGLDFNRSPLIESLLARLHEQKVL